MAKEYAGAVGHPLQEVPDSVLEAARVYMGILLFSGDLTLNLSEGHDNAIADAFVIKIIQALAEAEYPQVQMV